MLLPFLILAVRVFIFILALLGTLLIGSVFALISAVFSISGIEIVGIVGFVLLLFVPSSIVYLIHARSIRWFYGLNLPTWIPGIQYLMWRKQARQSVKDWDKQHGRREALDSFIALVWTTLTTVLYGVNATNSALITLPPELFFLNIFTAWLLMVVLVYGFDTWFRWRKFHKQWLKLPTKTPSKSNPQKDQDIDRELSQLKQQIQSQDGYLTQPKRINPDIAEATVKLNDSMGKVRFKGQIVQNLNGVKGEIVEIVERGSRYYPKECILGTTKASKCTLIILWDKQTTHEELPANSTLISPIVNTNNPLYPALNLIEQVKFRGNQE